MDTVYGSLFVHFRAGLYVMGLWLVFSFLLGVIGFGSAYGQEVGQDYVPYLPFGDVSDYELDMTACPIDSAAPAVVLFTKGEYRVPNSWYKGRPTVYSVHYRIKLLSQEAVNKYGNLNEVKRVTQVAKLASLKAAVYNRNPETGAVEVFNANSKDKAVTEVVTDVEAFKVALPGVRVGSVIEVKLKYRYSFLMSFQWTFQHEFLPQLASKVLMRFPGDRMRVETVKLGHLPFYDEASGPGSRSFEMRNLPAPKEEVFNLASRRYLHGVVFKPTNTFSANVRSFDNKLLNDKRWLFWNKLLPSVEATASSLVEGVDRRDHVDVLYAFVRDSIAWNGQDGYLFEESAALVESRRMAKSGEKNLYLINLLRAVGYVAYPVLVATQDVGGLDPTDGSSMGLANHAVARVYTGEDTLWLDASLPELVVGSLPPRVRETQGRMYTEDKAFWVGVGEDRVGMESLTAEVTIGADYLASLRGSHVFVNGAATDLLLLLGDGPALSFSSLVVPFTAMKGVDGSVKSKKGNRVVVDLAGKDMNWGTVSGPFYNLAPFSYLGREQNLFSDGIRRFPLELGYPFLQERMLSFTVPDGWAVESLPEPVIVEALAGLLSYELSAEETEGGFTVRSVFSLKQSVIEPWKYARMRAFFDAVIEAEESLVVIKTLN